MDISNVDTGVLTPIILNSEFSQYVPSRTIWVNDYSIELATQVLPSNMMILLQCYFALT